MKNPFYIFFVCFTVSFQAQQQEVPLGVKLTPSFHVPAITLNNFTSQFPGISPEWKVQGEKYIAVFRSKDEQLRRQVLYDRNGHLIGKDEQLSKKSYPKNIDLFYAHYYPDEKYEVWRRTDSAGAINFYGFLGDTIWFDIKGRYISNRPGLTNTLSETDLELLTRAATSQIMEASLAELVTVNSGSPELQNAVAVRTENNRKMHEQLRALAVQKHFSPPTELNSQQQKKFNDISRLQGREFDRAYTKLLLKQDEKNETNLKRALKHTEDAELKAWIENAIRLSGENFRVLRSVCGLK